MQYKVEKKDAPEWGMVDVLCETYEEGRPEGEILGRWRQKLSNRQDMLRYLENGERYWYAKEGFGSEKRKNPA